MKIPPEAFEIRTALLAASPLTALRALDAPGIAVCGVARDAEELPALVARMQPHALVLWDAPRDAQALMQALLSAQPARPPRVIARHACAEADLIASDDLPEAVGKALALPCARLAAPSLPDRESCAQDILDALGMSRALTGFDCAARGAALLSALPLPAPPLRYGLYPQLAADFGIAPAAVERRIRSAVESAWLNGDLAAQNRLLGLSVSAERGKPTNSELLFRLADCICERLYG